MKNIKLGVIGATGMAGREAIIHQEFLEEKGYDYADLVMVTGSSDSAGRKLGEVFEKKEQRLSKVYNFWEENSSPRQFRDMEVQKTDADLIAEKTDAVISALPSSVAWKIEPSLRKRGIDVFSNASEFRWSENIPLIIPEVNPGHINWVDRQQTKGKQVNNPNCTTAGFVPVIHALEEQGLQPRKVNLVTLQSVSGKGDKISGREYSQRIRGNSIDDWDEVWDGFNEEEQKSEIEPQKILGRIEKRESAVDQYRELRSGEKPESILPITAKTNRIPTQYGHLEALTVKFDQETSVEEFKDAIESWAADPKIKSLPSTAEKPLTLKKEIEPAEDVFVQDGMAVVLGRTRQSNPKAVSFYTLSHNLRRGATWTARQSLELYLQRYKDFAF